MKISELTPQDLKEYAREYGTSHETERTFTRILSSCKSFIKGYTGLSYSQMEQYEDLTEVVLVLSSELYDNRTFTVETDKLNPFAKSTLAMYSVNLL